MFNIPADGNVFAYVVSDINTYYRRYFIFTESDEKGVSLRNHLALYASDSQVQDTFSC